MKLISSWSLLLGCGVVSLTTTRAWSQQPNPPSGKNPPIGVQGPVEQQATDSSAQSQPSPPDTNPTPSSGRSEQGTSPNQPSGPDARPVQDAAGVDASKPPASVAATPAPATAQPATSTPVFHGEQSAERSEPVLPTKLALGKNGWVQVGALLQGWFDTQWRSDVPAGTSRSTQATFRLRRAEIKVSGDIVRDVASFLVSFDPAATYKFSATNYTVQSGAGATATQQTITTYAPPGNTTSLKLFWVTLKSPYIEASIGQFKYPISYEGQSSSGELIFPERAYSSRYFGDTYDMGIRLEKKFDWLKYQVFLINGTGQNQIDANLQKDLAVRLEVTPIDGLTVGGSGLTSIAERTTQPTTKDKVEAFGRFNKKGFLIQGELLWGSTGATASGVERTKARGRYAVVGYTIANAVQPVFRWGFLDTDHTLTAGQNGSYPLYSPFGIASDGVRSYEVGLNYFVQGNNFKLQAAYGYFDFHNVPKLQEATVSAQAMF